MSRSTLVKYGFFVAILVVGVGLDQWTKWYASERLATYHPDYIEHTIALEVPDSADGDPLDSYLKREFAWNDAEMVERLIEAKQIRTPDGQVLEASTAVKAGQRLEVLNRTVTIIEGYWEFEYTENPGAAFGLLSDTDSPYRLPFFIVVSVIALGVILYILRDVHPTQTLLIWSLSLIGTGAVGNFIDRLRFGSVIDFVVWKYGEAYRWPTFNVADSFITVGVLLMLVEIARGGMEPPEEAEAIGEDEE